jgi:hypothetical protein
MGKVKNKSFQIWGENLQKKIFKKQIPEANHHLRFAIQLKK